VERSRQEARWGLGRVSRSLAILVYGRQRLPTVRRALRQTLLTPVDVFVTDCVNLGDCDSPIVTIVRYAVISIFDTFSIFVSMSHFVVEIGARIKGLHLLLQLGLHLLDSNGL